MNSDDIFSQRAEAKDRLYRASDKLAVSQGLGLLAAKVSLSLAERHLNKIEKRYDQQWPFGTPLPGSLVGVTIENGSAHFGVVQTNGTVENFSVPTEPIVSRGFEA